MSPRILLFSMLMAAGGVACRTSQGVAPKTATSPPAPPPSTPTPPAVPATPTAGLTGLTGHWHNVDWPKPAAPGDTSSWQDLELGDQHYHLAYTFIVHPACEGCPTRTDATTDGVYTISNDTLTLDGTRVFKFALQGDQLTLDVVSGAPPGHFRFKRQ
jgi:hypothetical protein